MRFAIVVLPAPVSPTIATFSPGFILKDAESKTIFSPSYEKLTFSN
jgi:hypothetical protein